MSKCNENGKLKIARFVLFITNLAQLCPNLTALLYVYFPLGCWSVHEMFRDFHRPAGTDGGDEQRDTAALSRRDD